MKKVSWLRKSKQLTALLVTSAFLGVQLVVPLSLSGFMTASASAATQPDSNEITICHRDNDVKKPYTQITVSFDAATGTLKDNGQGDHTSHTGPVATSEAVAQSLKDNHDDWGDIIPSYTWSGGGSYAGLNWTPEGQAIWNNGCQYVTSITPTAPTMVDLTCNADGSYIIPSETGVTYSVDGVVTTAGTYTVSSPGTHVITAAAASTAYVLSGTTSWTFTFTAPTGCVQPPTQVTPTAPTMVDLTCNADGSYTIPSETGVTYSVNGKVTPAGTYTVTTPGTYTITAAPASTAYSLTGTTSWTFTFTAPTGCVQPPAVVTPQAVTFTQPTCQTPTGSYTIPSVTGVIYKVNNVVAGAGTYTVAAGTNMSITAEAASGYALANGATSSWSQTFTAVSGCVLGATDVCPNILGSQATVPSGYTKNSQGNCVTNSTSTPPHHEHGQVLGASTTAQLANTGQSVWLNVVVGASVLATVLGLGLTNRKNLKV